jgi:hypothetical protein
MAVIFAAFWIILFSAQRGINETASAYKPVAILSFDEKYRLQTERLEDETGVYASFSIYLHKTHDKIYICPDQYRTMDLESIDWEGETYNVVVQSGDIGTVVYVYDDDSWER